jgi:hypothetical protein
MNCTICLIAGGVIVALIAIDTIRRKKSSGVKPWIACLLDALCVVPRFLGVGPWKNGYIRSMGKMIANVKKRSGLSDMGGSGEEAMIARYDPILDIGVKKSGIEFSPAGVYFATSSLEKRVLCRLQMVDFMKKHPAVAKVSVRRPVFVIGFPRTGTTFLHELLGLHPDVRMHYSWEQMDPVPKTDNESMEALVADRKKRYGANKAELDKLLMVAGKQSICMTF